MRLAHPRSTLPTAATALVAGLLFAYGFATEPSAAMAAYTTAFVLVATTVVGALVLLMVAELTGASWFSGIRPVCQTITSATPALIPLFLPVVLGVGLVYPWARSTQHLSPAQQAVIDHARRWLGVTSFALRGTVYLALWALLAEALRRASRRSSLHPNRVQALSAIGLIVVAVTGTLAGVDWVMSVVPGWNFDIMGLYLLAGAFSSAVGLTSLLLWLAHRHGRGSSNVDATHALGKVLFMSVALWAYMAVSPLIIVWSANVPREVPFYLSRTRGSWRLFAWTLAFGHLIVPFFLLLPLIVKRSGACLALIGAWITLMHAVDVYWLSMPAARTSPAALDAAPMIALTSIAVLVALLRLPPYFPRPSGSIDHPLARATR